MQDTFLELAKFNNIIYYDLPHTYFLDGKPATSTTTLIHKFQKEFETERFALKKAEERGVSKEVILEEWRFKNKHAVYEGKTLHDYIEKYLSNKVFPYPDKCPDNVIPFSEIEETYKIMESHFHKFYQDVKETLVPIRSEIVIGDKDYMVTGMIDQLFWSKKTKQLHIFDWKTNTNLKLNNRWQKLLNPLSHLEDCEYNIYSLQLSTYKHIVEKNTNLKLGKCYLVWFNEHNESYRLHECLNLEKEVLMMMDYKMKNPELFKPKNHNEEVEI